MEIQPLDEPAAAPINLTALFLVLAGALMVGTILQQSGAAQGVNDGSRWNTVYYLVEHGTYEFLPDHGAWWGRENPTEPRYIPPFDTIDMVAIPDEAGQYHYSSSKPPFLPTVLAGIVWLIEKAALGHADFRMHPWFIIRTTTVLAQVLPLLIAFWLLAKHVRRIGDSPFVHAFCLAAITMGTYMTAWSYTLNNHVIAAATAVFALHATIRIWYDGRREWYWFAIAGFFGAFTAATELPAGLLMLTILVLAFLKDRRRALAAALPAALIPAVAAIVTNVIATGRLMPAYTDVFKPGGWYDYPGSYWTEPKGIDAATDPGYVYVFNLLLGHHGLFSLMPVLLICLAAVVRQLVRKDSERRGLAVFTVLLTAAIVAVYTIKTNNYGGWCKGPRWLFWLIPVWLLFLGDGVRLLATRRVGRCVCMIALAVSALSMADALGRSWTHSWFHRIFQQFQWSSY